MGLGASEVPGAVMYRVSGERHPGLTSIDDYGLTEDDIAGIQVGTYKKKGGKTRMNVSCSCFRKNTEARHHQEVQLKGNHQSQSHLLTMVISQQDKVKNENNHTPRTGLCNDFSRGESILTELMPIL